MLSNIKRRFRIVFIIMGPYNNDYVPGFFQRTEAPSEIRDSLVMAHSAMLAPFLFASNN